MFIESWIHSIHDSMNIPKIEFISKLNFDNVAVSKQQQLF